MKPTILLVEDNPDDVELMRLAFADHRIANLITVASDGVFAIELLHGTGDREPIDVPALILLDVNMPRMNGIETLKAIRSHPRTRTVPVVILTSSKLERDVVESYDLGVNSYVVKPVDFEQFVEATREIGSYWLLLNHMTEAHV
jgi:CheY-like chemotaxis protein